MLPRKRVKNDGTCVRRHFLTSFARLCRQRVLHVTVCIMRRSIDKRPKTMQVLRWLNTVLKKRKIHDLDPYFWTAIT